MSAIRDRVPQRGRRRTGYDAHVGERGFKLPGGQPQRIAIAHRLSTLKITHRLVVIDGGRIVEEGSDDALIPRRGLYAQLWARQSGGFLADLTEAAE